MERKLYSGNPFNDMGYGHRRGRGNRNNGNGYYGYGNGYGMPHMGYNRGYDYYGAPNFSDDYMGYGFPGNYDDGFFGMGGNQMPYGYNRGGRGMYGGYGGRGGKRRGGRGPRGGMWNNNRAGPRNDEMAAAM